MNKENDGIEAILSRSEAPIGTVRAPELKRLAVAAGCADPDDFIAATAKVCGLTWDRGERPTDEWFELHPDEWSLDLDTEHNRGGLFQVLVAAWLVEAGWADNSIAWVAQVLPAATDLAGAVVVPGTRPVRVEIPVTGGVLPAHLTETVHPLDYGDFLQTMGDAADEGTTAEPAPGIRLLLTRPAPS